MRIKGNTDQHLNKECTDADINNLAMFKRVRQGHVSLVRLRCLFTANRKCKEGDVTLQCIGFIIRLGMYMRGISLCNLGIINRVVMIESPRF